MLNINKALGIEKLIEDKTLLEKLDRDITDNVKYVTHGYSCDYYLRTYPGDIEFQLCRSSSGAILGTDVHFTGLSTMSLVFDNTVSNNGTVHYFNVHGQGSDDVFPIRVVCPDVLPGPEKGDVLFGQIIAFSDEHIRYISDDEAGNGFVRDNHNGNVIIAGRIFSKNESSFEFEGIHSEYYELEIETDIGRVTLVTRKENIVDPEYDRFIVFEALISFDVAVEPDDYLRAPFPKEFYKGAAFECADKLGYGMIPNLKNTEKLLLNCVKIRSFERFTRACSDSVTMHNSEGQTVIDNADVGLTLSGMIPCTDFDCKLMHILSCDSDEILGFSAAVIGTGAEPTASITLSVNKYGFVDEIWSLDVNKVTFGYDEELHALAMLGQGMCMNKADSLKEYISDNCIYRSEDADRMFIGKDPIIEHVKTVEDNIEAANLYYTYRIVPAAEALRTQEDLPEIYKGRWCSVGHRVDFLTSIVFIRLNDNTEISEILLSRNGNYLKAFESKNDQKAVNESSAVNVRDLLGKFYGRENTLKTMRESGSSDKDEDGVYVWREADRFALQWLKDKGYSVTDTEIEKDCIGYACSRKGEDSAVYVYAYGKQRSVPLDADYCQRLKTYSLSEGRNIIIVYLKVDTVFDETGEKSFKVGRDDSADKAPEMWVLGNVNGRDIIQYYPGHEMLGLIPRLMAAYNTLDLDLLKAICSDDACLEDLDDGELLNDGFYSGLSRWFERYGKMKLAYVRYDDVVFSATPYLDYHCRISFRVDEDRICGIKEMPLDDFRELLITDYIPESDPKNVYPQINDLEFLAPDAVSRFAVRMTFENGEIRRYDFIPDKYQKPEDDGSPDEGPAGNDEVIKVKRYCFTDKIFAHGKLVDHIPLPEWSGYRNYPRRGQGIVFVNQYSISTAELYFNSYPV